MTRRTLLLLLPALLPLLLSCACATVATCPGNLLPIVEIQVNSTASNHDDYGSTTSYTACRARITNATNFFNALNFPGGVAAEIRNPQSGPSNLLFSPVASGGSASLMQTLPANGGWLSFYVKGTSTSSVDKSSIIEMATAGTTCSEVVIARKAMMIPSGAPPISTAAGTPRVDIEIGSAATLDDYLAWSPVFSRIRWANGTSPTATLNVTLQNPDGRLGFAPSTLAGATPVSVPPLSLTLLGDGSWVNFYVAGRFPTASVADKDAILEVRDGSNNLLSREGLMVRIRKNANTNFTNAERDRYLEALAKLDITYAEYIFFVRTHSRNSMGANTVAHRQAHGCSGFLPWHRAFVLDIERKLQAADPSVALPYWKFDVNAPNVFTTDFMGTNDPNGGTSVVLSSTNPIVGWLLQMEGFAAGTIQRLTPYGNNGHPTVATEMATLALGSTFASFKVMETNPHNPAHSTSGSLSWIGPLPSTAVRDPLFFLLHCNVDRLWAKWQRLNNLFDATTSAAYDFQGSFAAPGAGVPMPVVPCPMLGQYRDDSMWPWDNVLNGTGAAARPDIAVLTPFPIALGYPFPFGKPTIGMMINYSSKSSSSPAPGMGFGYDDVQY